MRFRALADAGVILGNTSQDPKSPATPEYGLYFLQLCRGAPMGGEMSITYITLNMPITFKKNCSLLSAHGSQTLFTYAYRLPVNTKPIIKFRLSTTNPQAPSDLVPIGTAGRRCGRPSRAPDLGELRPAAGDGDGIGTGQGRQWSCRGHLSPCPDPEPLPADGAPSGVTFTDLQRPPAVTRVNRVTEVVGSRLSSPRAVRSCHCW